MAEALKRKEITKEETLLDRQRRDNIKREFCKNNGIKLLEIKYNENIEQILQINCQVIDTK